MGVGTTMTVGLGVDVVVGVLVGVGDHVGVRVGMAVGAGFSGMVKKYRPEVIEVQLFLKTITSYVFPSRIPEESSRKIESSCQLLIPP